MSFMEVGSFGGSGQVPLGILGMGTDLLNEEVSFAVEHQDDQAVVVAADVKDHPVSRENVGGTITILDVLWCFPLGVLSFVQPGREGWSGVRVLSHELFDQLSACDGHLLNGR